MLELFSPIKCFLREDRIHIDNVAFRLHSRVTVLVFLVCATLVTAKQFIGEPISCISDHSIDRTTLNAYCWIYSTFTVARHLKGIPGRTVASPGIGNTLQDDELYYHRYYQWVCFILGLQAILFYVPRALWKIWERDTVALLTKDLSTSFLDRHTWTEDRKRQLVDYFIQSDLRTTHNFYAFRYFLCELFNFINTIGQLYLLDLLFEGEFKRYGIAVIIFAKEKQLTDKIDPMTRLFPKVTKCTMYSFGSAGSTQIHDALCVLSLNVMNEKVFFFLWFWLIFLTILGFFAIFYRIIVFSQAKVRVYLLRASIRTLAHAKANTIVQVLTFGDCFLLHRLAQNVNPVIYRELIDELAVSLSTKHFKELV
ncbi:PREDICTED: innexin inx2-like [Polistes canadensis]|uniref:innexin inx2-like n=1 Tax=Polistes canadensis TaxID=91411 RepID=UPI000718EAEC|nr:PREDICTED: innexin inx2-like [Polistes canadensis]